MPSDLNTVTKRTNSYPCDIILSIATLYPKNKAIDSSTDNVNNKKNHPLSEVLIADKENCYVYKLRLTFFQKGK